MTQPPDASFELAAKKGWCRADEARVDACLREASAAASAASASGGAAAAATPGSDCMCELLALQKCLRARTLAERAIRGDNMGRS
jgi:hypothetical protein